jgi:hypothetical protein
MIYSVMHVVLNLVELQNNSIAAAEHMFVATVIKRVLHNHKVKTGASLIAQMPVQVSG